MNKIDRATVGNSTLRVISVVQGISGAVVIVSFHVAMTYGAAKVAQILNGIQELTESLKQNGMYFPPAKRIRTFVIAGIMSGSAAVAAIVLTSVDGRHGTSLHLGPAAFAEATLQHQMKIGNVLLGIDANDTDASIRNLDGSSWIIATVAVVYFSWWTTVLWGGYSIITISWVCTFWLLFGRFFKLTEKRSSGKLLDVSVRIKYAQFVMAD